MSKKEKESEKKLRDTEKFRKAFDSQPGEVANTVPTMGQLPQSFWGFRG